MEVEEEGGGEERVQQSYALTKQFVLLNAKCQKHVAIGKNAHCPHSTNFLFEKVEKLLDETVCRINFQKQWKNEHKTNSFDFQRIKKYFTEEMTDQIRARSNRALRK